MKIRSLLSRIRRVIVFALDFPVLVVALPIVVLLRLLRPFILIRLGEFNLIDFGRIGGLYGADWYLCNRGGDNEHRRSIDIFFYLFSTGSICNYQWVKMWKRILPVIIPLNKVTRAVEKLNRSLPGSAVHVVPRLLHIDPMNLALRRSRNAAFRQVIERTEPFLTFTPDEDAQGKREQLALGIPDGVPYICFHARDAAYLDAMMPDHSWAYHGYRDSDIMTYLSAAEELVRRGYYAVRVGSVVKDKIANTRQGIIDYATCGKRSDFLDIYLGAKCRFFLCSDTGISIVPELFRRPVVYVNWVPLQRISTWTRNGLLIGKKLYLRDEKRYLTFHEIINSEFGGNPSSGLLEEKGVELIDNTPEEIADVAVEMDQRLNGTWETLAEDEGLQRRFWDLFGPEKMRSPELRIGAQFLRQNVDLLNGPA
jgi:putative glycosyltransferase (TIGR04372 family)